MQNKFKNKKIWIVVLIIIIFTFLLLNFRFKENKSGLITECKHIKDSYAIINNWDNHISKCYGYIYASLPFQEKYYSIIDDLHDKDIAEVESLDDMNLVDNKIYLKPVNLYYTHYENSYSYDYFDGQQMKTLKASSVDRLPKYLIINIETAAIKPYTNFSDIPIVEQQYFLTK